MSFKFDSLIMILNKIDKGEKVTVNSLMEDLEMSERTIYRYLQTLLVADFPISYDKKMESYVFDEGYRLGKPYLSVEETLAFALAKKISSNFGAGMEKTLTRIEEKLSVKKQTLPRHIVLKTEKLPPQVEEHLERIHNAINNYKRIEIDYDALHSKEKSHRRIDPYYLFFQDGFWYLRGFCHHSKEPRTFGLDRITSLKVIEEHFIPKKIEPEEELSSAFGAWLDGKPTEVVLRFDKEIKSQVLRKKWHESQKVKELKDGKVEMRFKVKGLGGIKKWIYQWIPNVEVVKPKGLREEIRSNLKRYFVRMDNI